MIRNMFVVGLVSCLPLVLAGCSGGVADAPSTVAAKGTVTYKGNPVPKLSVAFMATTGKAVMGETDAQGNFTLMTNEPGDGAPVGDYTVTMVPIPDETPDMFAPPKPAKANDGPIPSKYSDPQKSGLKASVTKDPEKNVFKFDLE